MALKKKFSKGMKGDIRINQLKVQFVCDDTEKTQWNRWIEKYHYLGSANLCGRQLRYAITCRGKTVALLSFSAPAWHLAPRDEWLRWDEYQRLCRLDFIAQNSRFLVMPGVNTANLASKAISLSLNRLAEDWMTYYGHPLLLVETFVDKRFEGTCYQADNWIRLGETRGYSRSSENFYKENHNPKTLWVKELRSNAAETLRAASLPEELALYERELDIDQKARVFFKTDTLDSLFDAFSSLQDPRRKQGRCHSMASCLAIIACGMLAGCEGLNECAEFGRALKPSQMRALRVKYDRIRKKYLPPCHNTLWRVMSMIDPIDFERRVTHWYNSSLNGTPQAYAIDGKTLCNSFDDNGNPIHIVSAVSHDGTPFFFGRSPPITKAMNLKRHAICW